MAADAEHRVTDPEHRDLAVRAPRKQHAPGRQARDLVSMNVLQLAFCGRRAHPGLLLPKAHSVDARAPALRGRRHLAAERVGEYLMPEADADERPLTPVQLAQKVGERRDPTQRIVNRVLRSAAKIGVASVGPLRQLAVAHVVVREPQPGHVRREEVGEHPAIAARRAREAPFHVIALEEADVHQSAGLSRPGAAPFRSHRAPGAP